MSWAYLPAPGSTWQKETGDPGHLPKIQIKIPG
jgi:hypothetical protein